VRYTLGNRRLSLSHNLCECDDAIPIVVATVVLVAITTTWGLVVIARLQRHNRVLGSRYLSTTGTPPNTDLRKCDRGGKRTRKQQQKGDEAAHSASRSGMREPQMKCVRGCVCSEECQQRHFRKIDSSCEGQ
jgi:hypothetical protein